MADTVVRSFKVATQMTPTTDVVVRNMRAETEIELMALICRIMNLTNLNNLAFFEIHEVMPNGNIAVIRDGGDWPTSAITREEACTYATRQAKFVPPKPVPSDVAAVVDKLIQDARNSVDDDIGVVTPSFNYTVEEF